DVDHLDHDLFAFLQLVAHVLHAVVGNLGDVQQAVDAGHDLDERAEIGDAFDASEIVGVELRRGRQFLDHRDGAFGCRAIGRGDVHAPVVLDIDLHAG